MVVSQKQIAKKLGVSIAVVSRVLSGKAKEIGISEETIKKVNKTAKEMNYVSNAAARALKGKSTQTIGVVVYDFKDPFFGTIVQELHRLAFKYDYSLLLVGFQNRIPQQRDLAPLSKHMLDGIIAVGSDSDESWLEKFSNLPCARIGFGNPDINSYKLTIDEVSGYKQLVTHCTNNKLTNLTFLGDSSSVHCHRKTTLEKLCSEAELNFSAYTQKDTEQDSFKHGYKLAKELKLQQKTTLVCANDRMAMGAIHACIENGLSIPNDISIVGFDDIPQAHQFIPPITTIRQPIRKLTKAAFQFIIQKSPRENNIFHPVLILRKTL